MSVTGRGRYEVPPPAPVPGAAAQPPTGVPPRRPRCVRGGSGGGRRPAAVVTKATAPWGRRPLLRRYCHLAIVDGRSGVRSQQSTQKGGSVVGADRVEGGCGPDNSTAAAAPDAAVVGTNMKGPQGRRAHPRDLDTVPVGPPANHMKPHDVASGGRQTWKATGGGSGRSGSSSYFSSSGRSGRGSSNGSKVSQRLVAPRRGGRSHPGRPPHRGAAAPTAAATVVAVPVAAACPSISLLPCLRASASGGG